MLKKKKFFWWGILVLLLILMARIFYLYHKPHGSAAGETSSFSIDAGSLYRQFQENEELANKKYLGKVVEVSGRITEVTRNGQSEVLILSAGSGSGGVNCQLFPADKTDHHPTKPGDQVIVKGKCTGFLMDVNLADCIVEK
ncbi:OB-fold protein [Flavitalea flava]